jgi:uncharacterized NAD-dependent epimerase/dehydratase family protein
MHTRLTLITVLADTADRNGRRLIDVRQPPPDIPVASGRKRSGKRLLTVGTDCCTGKKYTALALHQALVHGGNAATFRATGQTGIMIAGSGIAMDAVISDFLPGAAEMLTPDNDPRHWDIIEGQGSLFHPAYAAVTLGLLHGSQADALVMCHEWGREFIDEYPEYPIPPLDECIRSYEEAAALTNPGVRCIGLSINASALPESERQSQLDEISRFTSLPCIDPVYTGVAPLLDQLR